MGGHYLPRNGGVRYCAIAAGTCEGQRGCRRRPGETPVAEPPCYGRERRLAGRFPDPLQLHNGKVLTSQPHLFRRSRFKCQPEQVAQVRTRRTQPPDRPVADPSSTPLPPKLSWDDLRIIMAGGWSAAREACASSTARFAVQENVRPAAQRTQGRDWRSHILAWRTQTSPCLCPSAYNCNQTPETDIAW